MRKNLRDSEPRRGRIPSGESFGGFLGALVHEDVDPWRPVILLLDDDIRGSVAVKINGLGLVEVEPSATTVSLKFHPGYS